MSQMTPADKARQIATLRYRLAQVAGLQRQHSHLKALPLGVRQSLDIAIQFAKVDSALRVARQVLVQSLYSLPASERSHFIKMHPTGSPGLNFHANLGSRRSLAMRRAARTLS